MAFTDIDQLKKDTLAQLGGETVPVEIGDDGILACGRRTLEVLSRYKPLTTFESWQTPKSGIHVHDCPPEVRGISSIDLTPTNMGTLQSMNIESAIMSGQPVFYSTTDTYLDIQYFDERLRWLKVAQRTLGSDPDYEYVKDPVTGIWSVYTWGAVPLWVTIKSVLEYDPKFQNIPLHLQKWVADYFKAEVMEVVGQVRGKFVKIPVAGGFMSMNGPELLAKAASEKKDLLEFLQSSRADLWPRWA